MPFQKDRTQAMDDACDEFNLSANSKKGKLRAVDFDTVRLLDKVRGYDWPKARTGCDAIQPLKSTAQISAAILHQRGLALSEREICNRCKKSGAWLSCVVSHVYQKEALHARACSNCIHSGNGSRCTLRAAFERSGGKEWNPANTDRVVSRGGLRAVAGYSGDDVKTDVQTRKRKSRADESSTPSPRRNRPIVLINTTRTPSRSRSHRQLREKFLDERPGRDRLTYDIDRIEKVINSSAKVLNEIRKEQRSRRDRSSSEETLVKFFSSDDEE